MEASTATAATAAATAAAPAVGLASPVGVYVDYPLSEQTVPHYKYYLTVDLK